VEDAGQKEISEVAPDEDEVGEEPVMIANTNA